jgi:hypothetical protein
MFSINYYTQLIELVLSGTMDGKLKWHRYDYYAKLWKVDDLLSDISKLDDKIEAAAAGLSHVGQNKKGGYVSDRNISRIGDFKKELESLKKNRRKKHKMLFRDKRSLQKYAVIRHPSVRHFCIKMSNHIILIREFNKKVIAHFFPNLAIYEPVIMNYSFRQRERSSKVPLYTITDEECPHLITMMIVLKGKNYLVDDERIDEL